MKKLLFLSLTIFIIIYVNSQENNQQKPISNPPPQNPNNNTSETDKKVQINNTANQLNATDKPKEKEFNLTDSLIKFFNEMFGNKTNDTDSKAKILEEEIKLEEKRKEEEKRKQKMEEIRINAEKAQKEKEKQKYLQLEKEREQFEKQIENISVSEFINLYLEPKKGELLYHNTSKPCNLKIIFLLTDTH